MEQLWIAVSDVTRVADLELRPYASAFGQANPTPWFWRGYPMGSAERLLTTPGKLNPQLIAWLRKELPASVFRMAEENAWLLWSWESVNQAQAQSQTGLTVSTLVRLILETQDTWLVWAERSVDQEPIPSVQLSPQEVAERLAEQQTVLAWPR